MLLWDFVVSFACPLPCEARNAEVEGAKLTTAILLVGLFKICQLRTNHCLTHREAQIKVYHLSLLFINYRTFYGLQFLVGMLHLTFIFYVLIRGWSDHWMAVISVLLLHVELSLLSWGHNPLLFLYSCSQGFLLHDKSALSSD